MCLTSIVAVVRTKLTKGRTQAQSQSRVSVQTTQGQGIQRGAASLASLKSQILE